MQYKNLAFSFLFQLLFAVHGDAQYQRYFDSLKNDLKTARNDTSMVSKLNLLCYAALEPAEQMDFAQRALALAQKVGYKKGEADALVP
jgi:hypothetical protein